MRQSAAIAFLALCASGLVVAASWDMPGLGGGPSSASGSHKTSKTPVVPVEARATAPLDGAVRAADVELTLSFHGQPVAGEDLRASVSAPEGAGIVSWAIDEAPGWLQLTPAGSSAILSGTVPSDASDLSFTVAGTDAAGRTFYAGSGPTALSPSVGTVNSGEAIGSAIASPPKETSPAR